MSELRFIDTHAHYDYAKMESVRSSVFPQIKEYGINYVIDPAIHFESNYNMHQLLDEYQWIYFAAGLHPKYASKYSPDEAVDILNKIKRLAADGCRVCAIGEAEITTENAQRLFHLP
ncbi:MAG: TatD family hydrolase [Ruminococcus sp.]|nr:TatD family hydrolase [Ruminococcus sp.]